MTTTEKQLDRQDATEIKNYTRVPNMLIFGYHDTISPQEKWLLVCLKHLCGRKGTRHLSLRYISEQTGISTGALSASKDKKGNINEGMIKHLHNAGLIHAEIKKHQGKGNPQYHITITDVWELNQTFFDKTCSDFGQDEEEDGEPVRNSDAPVQISDKLVQISDEPVRNSANTNIRYKTITNIREQEERTGASAIASARTSSFSQQQQQAEHIHIASSKQEARVSEQEDIPPDENNSRSHGEVTQAKPTVTKPARTAKAKVVELVPTAEEQAILDMWQSIFKRRIPINEALIKAAGRLVPCEPTLQDLKDCRGFCYTSNGEWYKKKGVQLSDIVSNWAKWQTTLELPPAEEAPLPDTRDVKQYASRSSNRVVSSFSDPNFNFEDEFYPSEAERRAEYAEAE